MAIAGAAEILFTGDFTGVDKDVGSQIGKLETGFNDGFGRIAKFAAASLATIGVGQFISGSLAEAEDAGKVASQTAAVIESTGGVAGVTAGQIDSLATALSNKSAVDDEVIASAQNVLLTFTNVRNEVGEGNNIFDQGAEAALNMSAALGTDLQGATTQIGKALNDPVKGITALTKAGVQFTDQQKEQIEAMVESGDTLGAQTIILAELETQFGGAAEAAATPSAQISTALGNLQEAFGTALVPVLSQFSSILTQLMPTLQPLLAAMGQIVGVLGQALVGALQVLLPAIEPLLPILTDVVATIGEALGDALAAVLPALGSLLQAFAPLAKPMAELVATIADALAPVLVTLAEALAPIITQIAEAFAPVLAELQPVIGELADAMIQLLLALLPILPPITQLIVDLAPLIAFVAKMNAEVILLITKALTPLIGFLAEVVAILLGALTGAIEWIIGVFGDLDASLSAIGQFFADVWNGIVSTASTAIDTVVDFVLGIPGRIAAAGASVFGGLFGIIGTAISNAKDWVGDRIDDIVDFIFELPGRLLDAGGDMFSWLTDAFVVAWNAVADFWNGLDFTIDLPDILPGPDEITIGFPDIPRFDDGGLVNGPTLGLLGEAARSTPEIISPERLMRQIVREEAGGLDGATVNFMLGDELLETRVLRVVNGRLTAESMAFRAGRRY